MHHQHNPFLAADRHQDSKGGDRTIELPGSVRNIVLQTRGGPLTPFEDRLADALMAVFDGGAEDLGAVVAALNAHPCPDANGQAWTEASLAACLHELGNALFAPEAIKETETAHG